MKGEQRQKRREIEEEPGKEAMGLHPGDSCLSEEKESRDCRARV